MRETVMGQSVAETTDAKVCKVALNVAANPSQALIDGDQFFLGSTEEKCREGAVFLAKQAKQARQDNGFSLSTLGSMLGKDATAAHRVFNDEDPSIALQAIAAHLLLDKTRTLLRGMARAVGCEVVERPRLTPEQKLDRLVETLRRHGRIGAGVLEEAFGEESP
jgi:hypothetical protein